MTRLSYFLLLGLGVLVVSVLPSASGSLLANVTSTVFGQDNLHQLPMAFGDFNSDKLTDLFVVSSVDRAKVSVLLARPQQLIATDNYFALDARPAGLQCALNDYDIVGVQPADFDGDGGMDVLLVMRSVADVDEDAPFQAVVLWGDHDQTKNQHRLLCPEKALPQQWHHVLGMTAEPLVIDANGDNIADLLGSASNASRAVWQFSGDRSQPPEMLLLASEDQPELEAFREPHSNSFVDLNHDGNADLFLTTAGGFELWQNVGGSDQHHFRLHRTVSTPSCDAGTNCVGQSAFADFDLDGQLDMLFPFCYDADCVTGALHFATLKQLFFGPDKHEQEQFLAVPVTLNKWKFDPIVTDNQEGNKYNPYTALTPRVGDINLDGYPDLLMRVQHRDTHQRQMHVLLNVEDTSSPTPNRRGFLIQPEIMDNLNDTVMATFYDLYEDGMEDMITVQQLSGGDFRVGAFTNKTQDSDAYFVKVIVLSGVCFYDCSEDHIQVPYGTNLPGQTICYHTQRPEAEDFVEIASCAPQLAQTAHNALQLPYTIFGLGMSPNFLDYIYVNVTNATTISSRSNSHTWTQIIPNSQVYVIPHPPTKPWEWQAKLFITPSRSLTLTGLALVGTCALCLVIILLLHWHERRQDHREKLQEAHRFHFDAM